MTTDGPRTPRSVWPIALAALALACAGTTRTRHGDRIDVASYPPAIQSAYRTFAVRCSRCHTLARPLNAHITDAQHWTRYVARMRRTPGSGINAQNAEIILRFLLYSTAHEKMPPPETPADVEAAPDTARDVVASDAMADAGLGATDGGQP
jgi:hypothetical protein